MLRRILGTVLLTTGISTACSASSGSRPLDVGRDGEGGSAGAGSGIGGDTLIGVPDSGASRALSAHIERDGMTITFVTLACAGDCADVRAVATGGFPPYTYTWEDGSTSADRRVCPGASTTYIASATDSGNGSPEFRRDPVTVTAPLSASVLDCTPHDAGPPGSGGATAVDAGPTSPTVYWASWTAFTAGTPGNAQGVLSPPGGDVAVTFDGELDPASQTSTGTTNNWAPASTFLSPTVQNIPPDAGMLALSGRSSLTQTVRFASPVRDPLIALWSLGFGSLGLTSTWEFDRAPVVLSSGVNSGWPFSGTLTGSGKDVTGSEGNGVLEFKGTFTELSFTVPVPEGVPGYGGFTVGIRGRG